MDIKSFKTVFDKQLRKYVTDKIKESQKIASSTRMQQIVAYIEDFMFSGGKRVRPYLVYITHKAYGGMADEKELMRFAQSHELLHSMALVHDDIIDKGEMRHGVATYHTFVAGLLSSTNKEHIGVAQAILMGDLIFSWVYDVLYSSYTISKELIQQAIRNVQETVEEVIAWQVIDVDIMVGDGVDQELLERKNHYKSGKYTFVRPMLTWALLAGASKAECKKIEKLGEVLGKAYQMRDDLLDVIVEEGYETTHYDDKTKFSDIQDGQQTYLTQYIYETGKYAHRLAISSAMGKRLSKPQIDELRQVFIDSGAVAYGKEKVEEYLSEAEKLLSKIKLPVPEYWQYFQQIIELLRKI